MKHFLTVVCALGLICGEVFTMYSPISIGAKGLDSMASSLESIGAVMVTYYKNLNAARNKTMSSINKLQLYANSTYKTMNETYGVSQPNMMNVMYSLDMFTRQFYYGEQQVISVIGNDLYRLNTELQQTMDNVQQSYGMLLNTFSFHQNAENCSKQFATNFSSLPNQLSKFGACLKTEVDTVPTVVAPLQDIFELIKNDFAAMNNQLKICAATSTSCINDYFNHVTMELNNINYELYMAVSLLSFYQQDAKYRNELCGELIKNNVQDASQNMISQFNRCMYPPTV